MPFDLDLNYSTRDEFYLKVDLHTRNVIPVGTERNSSIVSDGTSLSFSLFSSPLPPTTTSPSDYSSNLSSKLMFPIFSKPKPSSEKNKSTQSSQFTFNSTTPLSKSKSFTEVSEKSWSN